MVKKLEVRVLILEAFHYFYSGAFYPLQKFIKLYIYYTSHSLANSNIFF